MKELWLFTMRYPFGLGEAFLENEMPALCARFGRVVVIPEVTAPQRRAMPPNAELRLVAADAYRHAGTPDLLRSPRLALALMRSLLADAPDTTALRRQWSELRSRMGQFLYRMRAFERELMPLHDPRRTVVLSYWWHDSATVLGLLGERHPGLRFSTRAHGFDLFEAQNLDDWIPFRRFQLERTGSVFCVSRFGQEHLRQRHPEHADRFELFRLGTRDHGEAPFSPMGPLRVASCSFITPRKRVERIAEALALVRGPVEWTHFGNPQEPHNDGRLRALVASLPPHVKADLRGLVPNSGILDWYRSNPVDVFLHMSGLEGGVAVAAQEAASFGIPIIAADSGGLRELVREETGILLTPEPPAAVLASALDGFRDSPLSTAAFRAGVRRFWKANFRAETNFDRFHDRLLTGRPTNEALGS